MSQDAPPTDAVHHHTDSRTLRKEREKKMTEICGAGAISENALCGLLADMPPKTVDALYYGRER